MDRINSVAKFLHSIKNHIKENWEKDQILSLRDRNNKPYPNRADILKRFQSRWFRDQGDDWPLLPSIFRGDKNYDEKNMMLDCRRKLSLLDEAPEWDDYFS